MIVFFRDQCTFLFRYKRIMWSRLFAVHRQKFLSSSMAWTRSQSSTQHYPIDDNMFGLTDDQKEVR
jgi:hypothetical protein